MEKMTTSPFGMPSRKGFKGLGILVVLGLFAFGMWQVPVAVL